MADIVQGQWGTTGPFAYTSPVATTAVVTVVAVEDGEGNLIRTAATGLVSLAGDQAVSDAGEPFSTATIDSLAIDVTVVSFTGGTSPAVTFFVDRQGTDSLWYRVWSSGAVIAVGPLSANVVSSVLTSTARFGWSTTGTPTGINFSASVIGR
jgi:hypothetical protein